jgi:hypothetical protein
MEITSCTAAGSWPSKMLQAHEVSLMVRSICWVVQLSDHTSHSVYMIQR